jgi:DNA uptake protein ComE-like DNA-binding protein
MQRNIIQSALVAAALLLSAVPSFAADTKPATAAETKAISGAKAGEKSVKTTKASAEVKLVDINSAGKKALMTLPGIKDAEADKIIAGRPYLTKAHLVTHDILPRGVYENLKALVVAKQKPEPTAKPAKK